MKPLLSVQHLSYSYHTEEAETLALSDLNFEVEKGEFIAVIGPSGCGKSTLLSLIAGLLIPDNGQILFHPDLIRSSGIGYMLQKDHLLDWRSVQKNITLGLEIQKQETKSSLQSVHHMMEEYGLKEFAEAKPSQLSGGMRQRAALIRTLALKPDLLLLDEPFSALDYMTRINVCDDICRILRKEQKTAILVTHDLSEAISTADRIIVLTRRPAAIRTIVPISFDIPNRTPISSRNAPEFSSYFNRLWKELKP